jgi:hypothetical protein
MQWIFGGLAVWRFVTLFLRPPSRTSFSLRVASGAMFL